MFPLIIFFMYISTLYISQKPLKIFKFFATITYLGTYPERKEKYLKAPLEKCRQSVEIHELTLSLYSVVVILHFLKNI